MLVIIQSMIYSEAEIYLLSIYVRKASMLCEETAINLEDLKQLLEDLNIHVFKSNFNNHGRIVCSILVIHKSQVYNQENIKCN